MTKQQEKKIALARDVIRLLRNTLLVHLRFLDMAREFDSCKQAQRPERLVWPNIFCQI